MTQPSFLLIWLFTLILRYQHSTAYPCFELQQLEANPQCVTAPEVSVLQSSSCWAEKIQNEFGDKPGYLVEQVIMNRSTGNYLHSACYLRSRRCILQSMPPTGLKSWLPCQTSNSPNATFLIFTIRAGVGVKAWNTFVNPSGNASILAISTDDLTNQPDVFRSDTIDNLTALIGLMQKREIQMVVYKSNAIVLRLTFDASGVALTSQNWFTNITLKTSWPITDVARKTFNYFSIEGHVPLNPSGYHERRFFVNYKYGGCPADYGLLMVMDTDDVCDYAMGNFIAAPRILYNPRADGHWVNGAVPRADRLSIFVA